MHNRELEISLLLLRVSVFLVMFFWTLNKLINPGSATHIIELFYGVGVGNLIVWVLGIIELVTLLAFLAGFARTLTYGFVVIAHGISTLVSFGRYLAPFHFPNLLFFAAWPMLAAAIALFLLRDRDTLLSAARWEAAELRRGASK